ncbi:hypothetical protein Q5688_03265 [Microcoleus sp. herbarium5]
MTNDNLLSFNIRYLKKRSPHVWTTKGDRLQKLNRQLLAVYQQ